MWLFTRYGFFSVVQTAEHPDHLMVRARCREHLRNLMQRFSVLTEARIIVTGSSDYRYRIIVDKADWAGVCAGLGAEIDYSNFKDAVHSNPLDLTYETVLHRVWSDVYFAYSK